jgi:outer membrane protein assembly factor BamA
LFYAGGANTVRAFGVREIGPGSFYARDGGRQISYLFQNGEAKFVGNLEYRTKLFGDLNGAIFLDAGNVWNFQRDLDEDDIDLGDYPKSFGEFFDQLALGTGIGLRYDLGFLVIRLDWGLAIHCPYDTGRSGYFNAPYFKNAHTLHFAVGYPF